jgi:hypothetical protein
MEKVKPKVELHELGLFLKTIELDFKPSTNEERAELISRYFPVACTVEDIEMYEQSEYNFKQIIQEDYELLSRRENYFNSLGVSNPFL